LLWQQDGGWTNRNRSAAASVRLSAAAACLSTHHPQLTHTDEAGKASMVNVGNKASSSRVAVAAASVHVGAQVLALIRANEIHKGDVLTVAKLAGIMAAKHTALLIPLCHPVPVDHVDVTLTLGDQPPAVHIEARAQCVGRTGVEMEALTAATVAALCVYDMCKAVSKEMTIDHVRLLSKTGGKSGAWHREKTLSGVEEEPKGKNP
jgi:cyclic pyranopterin phosphate synthase